MADQILKKENKLTYLGGFLRRKNGSLVLTRTSLSFEKKDGTKVLDIPLADITSVNSKKGVGNGVDHLYVLYNQGARERQAKIQHFSIFTSGMGIASRITPLYFASWEQMINDARFGKIG
ncbi:MAG TPA: hypothetical protein VHC68_01015 [Candidatus Paceibacterota bacterium]|nr:hypothetical protein [Candidatus Paceibacterota bacterium]